MPSRPRININQVIANLGIDLDTQEGLDALGQLREDLGGSGFENAQETIDYLGKVIEARQPRVDQAARIEQQNAYADEILGQVRGLLSGEVPADIKAQQDTFRTLAGGAADDAYAQGLQSLARRGITGGSVEGDLISRDALNRANIEAGTQQFTNQRIAQLMGLLGQQQSYGLGQQGLGFNYDQLFQQNNQFNQQQALQQQALQAQQNQGWFDSLVNLASGVGTAAGSGGLGLPQLPWLDVGM